MTKELFSAQIQQTREQRAETRRAHVSDGDATPTPEPAPYEGLTPWETDLIRSVDPSRLPDIVAKEQLSEHDYIETGCLPNRHLSVLESETEAIDEAWNSFSSAFVASLPATATDLTDGNRQHPEAYVLDWLDAERPEATSIAVQVSGAIRAIEPMEAVWEAFDALPGAILAGGIGSRFTSVLLLPFDTKRTDAVGAIEESLSRVSKAAVVTDIQRVSAELMAAWRGELPSHCSDPDLLGACFFASHGFDPARLTLKVHSKACAFPDIGHQCGQGFWYCVHEQFAMGHIAKPWASGAQR